MGTIFLARHGQTVHNRDHILQGPRIDSPLSELGERQADSLANALAGQSVSAVFSSPLRRARQTAEAVVRVRSERRPDPISDRHPDRHADPLTLQIVPELYEMDYGNLVGRVVEDVRDELDQVLDAWKLGFVDQAFPGGESPILAQHRIRPFAHRVVEQARRENVVVVGHGRINRILMATWTGAGLGRLEEFPQSNASLSELAVGTTGVNVVRLNDVSHLALASDSFA